MSFKRALAVAAIFTASATTITGCSSLLSYDVSIDPYETHTELIAAEFREKIKVNVYPNRDINTIEARVPKRALKAICEREAGRFKQMSSDDDVALKHMVLDTITGKFACVKDHTPIWGAEINARKVRNDFGQVTGYTLHTYSIDIGAYLERSKAEEAKRIAEEEKRRADVEKSRAAAEEQKKRDKAFERELFLKAHDPKRKGQKVCKYSNHIGYVEDIAGDKIKVLVKGRVYAPEGFFFKDRGYQRIVVTNLRDTVWADNAEWVPCEFSLD